jgi:hypothetical protein
VGAAHERDRSQTLLKMGYKKVRVSCGHSLRDRVRQREERKREREKSGTRIDIGSVERIVS